MAKLPLITTATESSGPNKVKSATDASFDNDTGILETPDLTVSNLTEGIAHIDATGNVSSSAIVNADIDASAAIGRSKIATGANNALVANDGTGALTEILGTTADTALFFDGTSFAPRAIDNTDVGGLGTLATKDDVDLATDVTGTLGVANGGTGKATVTAGALLLGDGVNALAELVGTAEGQVVKWNNSTETWYAGTGGGGGGGGVESVTGTSPINVDNTDAANPVVEIDQTALSITLSQVSDAGDLAAKNSIDLDSGSSDYTGTLPAANQAAQSMGGDVSGTTASATVAKLQGNAVSTATPANNQTLVWSTSSNQWVPGSSASGGSGGGGVTYYMNFGTTTNIGTTSGIPTNSTSTPTAPPYQLGRTSIGSTTTVTSATLGQTSYEHVCSFVTIDNGANDPNITSIPAGLWDFNIWARQIGGSNALQTSFQVRVYKYSSSNVETLLQSSDDIFIYDPTVVGQYIAQVNFPQTTILATDRIVVELWAKAAANNRSVEFSFNGNTASHCHTTIPSVSGTGLVKVVDGAYQTPASALVDADVASNAAIARSKMANGTANHVVINNGTGEFSSEAQLAISRGGTNGTATPTDGGVAYGNGTAYAFTTAGTTGQVLKSNGASAPSWADLSSVLPNNVAYLDGTQTFTGDKTFSGTINYSALTASKPLKLDSSKNLTSAAISLALAGGEVSGILDHSMGGTGKNNAATSGYILVADGSGYAGVAMSGDATISSLGAVTVTKIQGISVTTTDPTAGQALVFDGADYIPTTVLGVTSQTANTVYAAPNGSSGTPSFRSLVADDLPSIPASKITSIPYDMLGVSTGTYANSEVIFRAVVPRNMTLDASTHYFKCLTASTGSKDVIVYKNGSTVMVTATYTSGGGTTASVVVSATSISAGDEITVVAPSSSDATLAGVYFTLKGVVA
jgi:hypothetical protein